MAGGRSEQGTGEISRQVCRPAQCTYLQGGKAGEPGQTGAIASDVQVTVDPDYALEQVADGGVVGVQENIYVIINDLTTSDVPPAVCTVLAARPHGIA